MTQRTAFPLVLSILFLGVLGTAPVLASEGAPEPAATGEEAQVEEAQIEAPAALEVEPAAEPGVCVQPQPALEQQPDLDRAEQSSCCIDECFRDKQCDRVCAPFGGECVMVNSCCRECFCFG